MRVAAFQMTVTSSPEDNYERIEMAVRQAAQAGARVIALPECALCGYPPMYFAHPWDIDAVSISRLNYSVAELAARHHIWVILGTIKQDQNRLVNSALVIDDGGDVVMRYDKLHLMPADERFFSPGETLTAFEIDGVHMGVLICYDARFPEPFRHLRNQGARVIVNISHCVGPEMWKLPVLEGTYRARASENSCFLIAVNAAGPQQFAVSRIVGPAGVDVVAAKIDTEQLLIADIDPQQTDEGYYYDRRDDLFDVRFTSTAPPYKRPSPQ